MNLISNTQANGYSSLTGNIEKREMRVIGDTYRNPLTRREKELLTLLSAGFTSLEIGRNLFITKETVDSHRKNILRKLRVPNMTAAVAQAIRNDLI